MDRNLLALVTMNVCLVMNIDVAGTSMTSDSIRHKALLPTCALVTSHRHSYGKFSPASNTGPLTNIISDASCSVQLQ
jgi:hypothetical protein